MMSTKLQSTKKENDSTERAGKFSDEKHLKPLGTRAHNLSIVADIDCRRAWTINYVKLWCESSENSARELMQSKVEEVEKPKGAE